MDQLGKLLDLLEGRGMKLVHLRAGDVDMTVAPAPVVAEVAQPATREEKDKREAYDMFRRREISLGHRPPAYEAWAAKLRESAA